MKKQILMIIALSLVQGAIAMAPRVPTLKAMASRAVNAQLYKAAEEGDYNKVAKLLKAGADVNATGDYGNSALAVAAENGHEEIVKLLLENHALVDAREAGGTTPLMWAASADIVELLLHAGADINAVDRDGRSVLYHALARPNIYVIQSLLENGANIDTPSSKGDNPLIIAAHLGDEELVMLLLTSPNPRMIERAIAGFNAIERTHRPTKDIRWLLKQAFITQLVQDQMNRIAEVTNYSYGANGLTASDIASVSGYPNLSILLNPNIPASVARIRARVEQNIRRIILGAPRQPLEPAQGLTQEEVDDIMGRWLPERE